MKAIIKRFIPAALKKRIHRLLWAYVRKINLKNVFGFDIYHNSSDTVYYKKFVGKAISDVENSTDGRIFHTMDRFIRPGSVVIDVGANIGLMTLVMSKLVGNNGKVLSFEPGPVSYGLLRRNVFTNVLNGNVTISDNALSDSLGSFNLFINSMGESDNQLHKDIAVYTFKDELPRAKFIVNTQTIDHYLAENEIDFDRVSFIKIDTQGHDLSVLRGGRSLFSKATNIAVLVEFAPYLKAWEKQNIDEFYNELVSLGFDIYDDANLKYGKVDLDYLESNYGFDKVGKYTDLLLLKGQDL
jgi:FkbM family methyltransferase